MKGFEVEVIARGENMVPKINSFNPDLILFDVLISGSDGRTICKQLKSDKATQHIPVIMFSAHPGAAATISAYGTNYFIAKTIDISHLLKKVNEQPGINLN